MFYTSTDRNLGGGGDGWGDDDVGKEVGDGVGEPAGETLLVQDGENEVMMNGVEGFAVVSEENMKFILDLDVVVEGVGQTTEVVRHESSG